MEYYDYNIMVILFVLMMNCVDIQGLMDRLAFYGRVMRVKEGGREVVSCHRALVFLCYIHGFHFLLYVRVPTLPGKPTKPGILSFSFPDMENAWNLFKKW